MDICRKCYIYKDNFFYTAMRLNQDYKNEALAALKGNWAPAVVATIILYIMSMVAGGATGLMDPVSYILSSALFGLFWLFTIFVINPLQTGYANSLKTLSQDGDSDIINNMFRIGFGRYLHIVWGTFLTGLFTFLWALLLIVPGIIKSFSYAMTPFILIDNPELTANEAIDRSRAMMRGHKFDLFWLLLSFIGWFILCMLTLGIGFFWLIPYTYTSVAGFYKDVKAEYESRQK